MAWRMQRSSTKQSNEGRRMAGREARREGRKARSKEEIGIRVL